MGGLKPSWQFLTSCECELGAAGSLGLREAGSSWPAWGRDFPWPGLMARRGTARVRVELSLFSRGCRGRAHTRVSLETMAPLGEGGQSVKFGRASGL